MWWQLQQSCYYGASPISLSQVLGQWLCSVFTLFNHLNTHLTGAKKPKHCISIPNNNMAGQYDCSQPHWEMQGLCWESNEKSVFHWLIPSTSHSPYIKTQWRVLQTSSDPPPSYISDKGTCKYRKCELWLLARDTSCEGVSIPQLRDFAGRCCKTYKTSSFRTAHYLLQVYTFLY